MKLLKTSLAFLLLAAPVYAEDLPIFDAHIHYSHDAVQLVPPQEVAAILLKAGIKHALVSSSDDNGTQKLLEAAPEIVVPALRPYRRRGEIGTWMHDDSVIDYVEANLKKNKYYALGEFHAYGRDIETPVLRRMIELAREYDLLLHAHSDADAVNRIFKHYPDARVLWAHSGFDDADDVADLLRKHDNLWADLAFRSEHGRDGKVAPSWRKAFEEFPDRFMVGTDTFAPERWYYVGEHAAYSRDWLSDLPDDLARNIAYRNAMKMLDMMVE